MPIETRSKMWYIIDPYHYIVWLTIIPALPIHLIAMGLTDYFYYGAIDWDDIGGLIIRNVLSENNFRLADRAQAYQKILDIIWIWSMLVIVQAYSGNLTAMLAKTKLQQPIRTLEELMNQGEMSWVLEKGVPAEFVMKYSTPEGSTMKNLYNGASLVSRLNSKEYVKYGCPVAKLREDGKSHTGSICDANQIFQMFHKDFGETGKCNFYLLEEDFFSVMSYMAFQVRY